MNFFAYKNTLTSQPTIGLSIKRTSCQELIQRYSLSKRKKNNEL